MERKYDRAVPVVSCFAGQCFMLAALLVTSPVALAGGHVDCCAWCGETDGVRSVCRPVWTTTTENVTCWDVTQESVAVPFGYSHGFTMCGAHEGACCPDGACGDCASGACARCCKVRPRNRLLRKTLLKETPVVVWTVEHVCQACMHRAAAAAPLGQPAPQPELRAASTLDGLNRTIRSLLRIK
jgi:hypothetical protein